MKKVYLLGDSIMHIGYGTVLSDVLGEEYEVLRPVSFVKIQGGDCYGS